LLWAVPLVVLPDRSDAFSLPKQLVSGWLASFSLLLLLPWLALQKRVDLRTILANPAVRIVGPLILIASFAALSSPYSYPKGDALFALFVGGAALVGWSAGLSKGTLAGWLECLVIPAVVLSVLAILQFHGWFRPFEFQEAVIESRRTGVTSLAGATGDLAAYLVLPCLVLVAGIARTRRARAWRLAALGVCAYAQAVTQTITAVAALLVGITVLLLLLVRGRAKVRVAVVLAFLGLLAMATPLRERALVKVRFLAEGKLNEAFTGRLDGWKVAAKMWEVHPVLGIGHGAYRAAFGETKLEIARANRGIPSFAGEPNFLHAHNELLEIGAEWGWLGIVALGLGLAQLLRYAATSVPEGDGPLAWGGLVALGVLCLGHFPFRLALTAYPAVVFFAWLLADGTKGADIEVESGFSARWLAAVLAALLLAGLWIQTRRGGHRLEASRLVWNAQGLGRAIGAGDVGSGALPRALQDLRDAEALDPMRQEIYATRGSLYFLAGRLSSAREAYERAASMEIRPETLFPLGLVLWRQGDRQAALARFDEALLLSPSLHRRLPKDAKRLFTRSRGRAR
jgi:O-antigen ligase